MTTCATAANNPLSSCAVGFQDASISHDAVTRKLATPAWTVTNLEEIWDVIMRGTDFVAMGANGVTARARRVGRLDVSLRMVFSGWATSAGGKPTGGDPVKQLAVNRRDWTDNVVVPSSAADSTRLLMVTEDDGSESQVNVHVQGFQWRQAGTKGLARAVMDLSVPAGRMPSGVPPALPNDQYGGAYE